VKAEACTCSQLADVATYIDLVWSTIFTVCCRVMGSGITNVDAGKLRVCSFQQCERAIRSSKERLGAARRDKLL